MTAPIFTDDATLDVIVDDANGLAPATEPAYPGDDADADGDVVEDDVLEEVDAAEEYVDGAEDAAPAMGEDGEAPVAGGAPKTSKRYYNVIAVMGAPMPSENARYAGSSPSVAAKKAARKVWDKSGKKSFTLIMRKVCQQVAGRTLYKYDMKITKLADPIGFFSAVVPKFKTTSGVVKQNESKRVKIVRSSPAPVFGYVDESGKIVEGSRDDSGQGTLHRSPKNNTLTFNIGSKPMPKKVGTLTVDRTDWQAEFKRQDPSDSERSKHDVAGAHKKSVAEAATRSKLRLREKSRAAKAKAKTAATKSKKA